MAFFANGGANPQTGGMNAGISLTPGAAQIAGTQYGAAYGQDMGVAGIGGTDAQGQQQTGGMLSTMSTGAGPNASVAQNQAATGQAQQFAQAQGQSGRGQFGLAGAAHAGMQTAAGVGQAGAAQNQVLAQQQQYGGVMALQQQQTAQRAQDLQASGLDAAAAQAQANLESQSQLANQQTNKNLLTGVVSGIGSMLGI
jgi:hypothetical protein